MLWDGTRFKKGVTEPVSHVVIDPWGPYPNALRMDALDYNFKGKNVLCISTLEHIGVLEYGNTVYDPIKAFELFCKVEEESMSYLFSWPIGENEILDRVMRLYFGPGETYPSRFMFKRISANNDWEMSPSVDWTVKYNSPYPCGNGVIFVADDLEWING